jgi:hypothetical protein
MFAHVALHHQHHNYSDIIIASTVICFRYSVPPLTLTTISQESFRAKPRRRTRLVRATTSHTPSPSVGPYNSEHIQQPVIPSATHIRPPKQSTQLEMPNIHRTVPSLPELPSPFNNTFDVYTTSSLFDPKPTPKPKPTTKMSSQQPSSQDRKPSKASDASSILSTSTTSSMTALLKAKFTPKSKQSKPDELSPGEKQAIRRADRMDPRILATIASLK